MKEFMIVIFVIFAIFWFWNVALEIRFKAHKNSLLELNERLGILEYQSRLNTPTWDETNFGDKP